MAQVPISELFNRIEQLKQRLISEMPNITLEYAETTNNLVIADIQKKGITGRGYSTTPMYASVSMFNNKVGFHPIGKNEEKALKTSVYDIKTKKRKSVAIKPDSTERKTMYLEDGYKELRSLNGLPTDHIDLTFSGRMLQNIRAQKVNVSGLKFIAVIGAGQLQEQKKMEGQHKRFGDFLKPSADILKITNQIPINRINTIIEQTLQIQLR